MTLILIFFYPPRIPRFYIEAQSGWERETEKRRERDDEEAKAAAELSKQMNTA
jgi:hypothetical protein